MAIRFGNGFGMGASNNGGGSLSFFTNITTIASYLRGYMSDFKNPDFYEYVLDGDGYYIYDGGNDNDMYDDGNATSPWLISNISYTGNSSYNSSADYPYAVNYQTTGNTGTVDTSFGYVSLGYSSPNLLPLTVIGARATIASPGTPIGFQCGGNIGADGGGTFVEGNIYTGDTVSGFTVHSYYRQTYDAGDPSVCDVFILLGHPEWNSVFGDVFYGGDSSNQGSGSYLYTTGNGAQNVLAIKTLLSKEGGVEVTFSEINTVVDNFIARIKEAKDSTTPTPTPTPSATSDVTPTPTPSATSDVTPTPTPSTTSVTPTPTKTNTPTPTPTPPNAVTGMVTISEVGSNVVMTISGAINLSGLTLVDSNFGPLGRGGLGINTATFISGPDNSYGKTYSGFTSTPSNFGTGGGGANDTSSGNIFGVITNGAPPYLLIVPTGYTSGTNISSTQTFTGKTFSSLGLTPGTYTYTWSGGSIDVVVGAPSPTPTPTPSAGAAGSCDGVGSWYFYSDEGTINAGPPIGNGNAIFTVQGNPITETFNPNKTNGTTSIYFDVNNSSGTDYTSQFNSYSGGTGTISICQNGNKVTYVGQGIPGSMMVINQGGYFFALDLSMLTQTVSFAGTFTYTDPIYITFGS